MKKNLSLLILAVFALTLMATSAARADKINFSWQTSFNTSSILPDSSSSASIQLSPASGNNQFNGTGNGPYNMGMAVQTPFASFWQSPTTYTNKPFVMTLTLTDGPSGLSDSLKFQGIISGTNFNGARDLADSAAAITFSDGQRSVEIGSDIYHINMQQTWVIMGQDPIPNILATINATSAAATPEPSSLALAASGVLALFLRRRLRKKSF